jgi:general secretion pathway protein N
LQPEGEVQIQTQGFALNAATPSEAIIVWRNATLNLSTLQPLGDYRLQLRGTDGKIDARLETQDGKLHLEGVGAYSKQNGFHFSGSAHADPAYAAKLQALLALLGKDRGDGVHIFSLRLQ